MRFFSFWMLQYINDYVFNDKYKHPCISEALRHGLNLELSDVWTTIVLDLGWHIAL